jgi:hypothetical protein
MIKKILHGPLGYGMGLDKLKKVQRWNLISFTHSVLQNKHKLVHKAFMNNLQIAKEKWKVDLLDNKFNTLQIPHFHTIHHIANAYRQDKIETHRPTPTDTHSLSLVHDIREAKPTLLMPAFDGSYSNGSAGSGVVIMSKTIPSIKIKDRPLGEQTSATAELLALFLLLKSVPLATPLVIFGDNLNTISLKNRTPHRAEERLILKELAKREAP